MAAKAIDRDIALETNRGMLLGGDSVKLIEMENTLIGWSNNLNQHST